MNADAQMSMISSYPIEKSVSNMSLSFSAISIDNSSSSIQKRTLESYTLEELIQRLEKSEKTLNNKYPIFNNREFLNKLPDKGRQIIKNNAKIKELIRRKNVNKSFESLSSLSTNEANSTKSSTPTSERSFPILEAPIKPFGMRKSNLLKINNTVSSTSYKPVLSPNQSAHPLKNKTRMDKGEILEQKELNYFRKSVFTHINKTSNRNSSSVRKSNTFPNKYSTICASLKTMKNNEHLTNEKIKTSNSLGTSVNSSTSFRYSTVSNKIKDQGPGFKFFEEFDDEDSDDFDGFSDEEYF